MEESEANAPVPWDDLVTVGRYPSLDQAHEHGLVILAMGEACWVSTAESDGEFRLHAETNASPRIRDELLIYDEEIGDQLREKRRPEWIEPAYFSAGWEILLLWMTTLVVVFYFESQDFTLMDRAASSSIDMIDHHEWWRPFTALFLHADIQHLTGNLLSGAIFGSLVSRSLGPLRGWLLILFCGTLGNVLTAWSKYPEAFQSIGASTAVFGALGILTGLGFSASLHQRWRRSWMKAAAPVMAGIILLGWLGGGAGSMNTDVLGHLFGFSSGLVSGFITGELRQRPAKVAELTVT